MRCTQIIVFLVALALLFPLTACGKSPEEARVALGQMGITYNADAFVEAAGKGDTTAVKLFLDAGMKPDTQKNGMTALMGAAMEGHTGTMQALLDKGADVNAKVDNWGNTALILVAYKGHIAAVQALLDNGADVNAKNNWGGTALTWAAGNGQINTVQALLDNDADVNAKNKNGATALIAAATAAEGRTAIVQALLDKGADVNAKTKESDTALTLATMEGHTELVELLKQAGAKE